MNISNTKIDPISILKTQKLSGSYLDTDETTGVSDRLTISDRASAIQAAKQHISKLPCVRADKVDAFRNMVTDGSYKTSPHDVASAIFDAAGNSGKAIED